MSQEAWDDHSCLNSEETEAQRDRGELELSLTLLCFPDLLKKRLSGPGGMVRARLEASRHRLFRDLKEEWRLGREMVTEIDAALARHHHALSHPRELRVCF